MAVNSAKIESVVPLSPTQAGMLYHTISSPGSAVYIGQHKLLLENVDFNVLQQAWNALVRRHSALRTIYVWEGLSKSVQLVLREHDCYIEALDFSENECAAEEFCNAQQCEEFDLEQSPPSRLHLLHIGGQRSILAWTRHHLVVDGWSAHTVLRELQQAYDCLSSSKNWCPDTVSGFENYIAWLQNQDLEKARVYWHAQASAFENASTGLDNIRLMRSAPQESHRIEQQLSQSVTQQLADLSKTHGITLSTLLHAAWAGVLSGVDSGQSVAFGSTCSGRPATLANASGIVGNFIQTLPLSVSVHNAQPLRDFLMQLQLQILSNASHAHLEHSEIMQALGRASGDAAFDSIVVFMNYPQVNDLGRNAGEGLSVLAHTYDEHSHYPLALLAVPEAQLKLILIYDRSAIADGLAGRLLNKTAELMNQFAKTLSKETESLTTTEFFSPTTTAENEVCAGPVLETIPVNVVQRFLESVNNNPSGIAATSGKETIRYEQLYIAAKNLAAQLKQDYDVRAGDQVLILMPRSLQGLVSIWATLLIGASYVPLTLGLSAAKIADIKDRCEAKALVSNVPIQGMESCVYTNASTVLNSAGQSLEVCKPTGNSLAYTIFTSGSTGVPKQVRVSHANLAHSVAARLQFYPDIPEVFGLMSPFAFDSSVAGIFWASSCASCLLLVEESLLQSPKELAEFLIAQRCTTLLTLPAVYSALLDAWPEAHEVTLETKTLNTVIVAGEACTSELLHAHRLRFPGTDFVNEYGPTETTVWCCAKRFDLNTELTKGEPFLPIGKAIAGLELEVLDAMGRPVPPGVRGELIVHGPTVARYSDESNSDSANSYATGDIVEIDECGDLLFRGRSDEQLKIRGHRVEPAEIEAAIQSSTTVGECAVVMIPGAVLPDRESISEALKQLPIDQAISLLERAEQSRA